MEGKTGLFVDERSPDRPWFDTEAIAKEIGAKRVDVEAAIQKTQR